MSSNPSDVPDLAARLRLEPHPEGGWYRQTWRSPVEVTLADGRVRPTATLIWFLLPAGEASAWHTVASDELWLAHTGTVRLEVAGDGEAPGEVSRHSVGTDLDAGEASQVLVPAGHQGVSPPSRDAWTTPHLDRRRRRVLARRPVWQRTRSWPDERGCRPGFPREWGDTP